MSADTVQTKTPDNVPEDNITDEPTNTKSLNANNDTVIEIGDDAEEQKISEAEQLKQAVFKDQGLNGVYIIAGKGKKRRPKRDEYGGNIYSNRPIWVQAMMSQPSGQEIGEESRGPFIRKVFAILFFCMLFTCVFAAMTFFVPDIRLFFRTPAGLMLGLLALIVLIPVSYAITCSDCARVPPCNVICLILAVLCYTVIFGFLTAQFNLRIVFMALFITTIIVLICFLLAFTPVDFTKFYIYVIVLLLLLIVFSMVVSLMMIIFNQKFTMVRLLLCFGMAFFQTILLIIEIQMVIGGKTVALGEDDYVLGAFLLYTSILELFFQILKILALLEDLEF